MKYSQNVPNVLTYIVFNQYKGLASHLIFSMKIHDGQFRDDIDFTSQYRHDDDAVLKVRSGKKSIRRQNKNKDNDEDKDKDNEEWTCKHQMLYVVHCTYYVFYFVQGNVVAVFTTVLM